MFFISSSGGLHFFCSIYIWLILILKICDGNRLLTPPGTPLFPSSDGNESLSALPAPKTKSVVRSTSTTKASRVWSLHCYPFLHTYSHRVTVWRQQPLNSCFSTRLCVRIISLPTLDECISCRMLNILESLYLHFLSVLMQVCAAP